MKNLKLKRIIVNILLWLNVWFLFGYWVLVISGVIHFKVNPFKAFLLYTISYLLGQVTLFISYAIVASKSFNSDLEDIKWSVTSKEVTDQLINKK